MLSYIYKAIKNRSGRKEVMPMSDSSKFMGSMAGISKLSAEAIL